MNGKPASAGVTGGGGRCGGGGGAPSASSPAFSEPDSVSGDAAASALSSRHSGAGVGRAWATRSNSERAALRSIAACAASNTQHVTAERCVARLRRNLHPVFVPLQPSDSRPSRSRLYLW